MNCQGIRDQDSLESISALIYAGGMTWDVRLWERRGVVGSGTG